MKDIKTFLFITFSILLISKNVLSNWYVLENSPTAGSRFNDCYFINPSTGWICSADNGIIYKTINGGNNWFIVGESSSSNRSITFFDSQTGFTGEFNAGNEINRTTNGGITWQIYNLPAPSNTGICGFSIAGSNVIYGCGRYWGPARVIKSSDRGFSWINIDMSGYTSGLVDCYFTSPDSGIAVGRTANPSRGIILKTNDGGINWDTVFVTANTSQWCWKISFPSRLNGFISLENASLNYGYFLKTTDGGLTWEEKLFLKSRYDQEGIGFINSNTGWIGGWNSTTFQTTDGGESWDTLTGGDFVNINRFRFIGDSIGYAVGERVYKFSKTMTNAISNSSFEVSDYKLYQNYPNPFNPTTNIKIDLPDGQDVRIVIFDILGNEVSTLIEGDYLSAGTHEFRWNASDYPTGVYYYKIFSKDFEASNKMVLIK